MKELAKRVSVALWGIPLLLYICYAGGYFFLAFVLIVNGMALWEFYAMFEGKSIHAHRPAGVVLSSLYLLGVFFFPAYWQPFTLLIVAVFLLLHLTRPQGLASSNTAYSIAGFMYISVLLATLLMLRLYFEKWVPSAAGVSHAGGFYIIVMFAAIWICDTAAYFGGKALGRHKLAPNVSPNKTVEGGLFGLIFGILSFWALGKLFLPGLSATHTLLAGAVVGVLGQLGDLIESRFKRDAGVKDTSALLPGHGGFLDRFDSIIFVSPFLWLLCQYGGTW